MKRSAECLLELGFDGVWSYVNSGNLVLEAAGSRASIEAAVERRLESEFGFEVTTFVRTVAEIHKALDVKPFALETGDTYFITFLKDVPSASVARQLEAASNDFDTLVVHGRDVHWHMRGKSTDTTLKRATWNLVGERRSTSRNVTMLQKLLVKIEAG